MDFDRELEHEEDMKNEAREEDDTAPEDLLEELGIGVKKVPVIDFSHGVKRDQLFYKQEAKPSFPKSMHLKNDEKEKATHYRLGGGFLRLPLQEKNGLTTFTSEAISVWMGIVLNGGFPGFAYSEAPAPAEEFSNTWFDFDVVKGGSPLNDDVCSKIVLFVVEKLNLLVKLYQILILRNNKGMHFHASVKMNKAERLSFVANHTKEFHELIPEAKWDVPTDGLRPMGCWKTCKPHHPLAKKQPGDDKWTAPLCYLPAWYGNNQYQLNVEAMKIFSRLFTSFGDVNKYGYFEQPTCTDFKLDGLDFDLVREIFLLSSVRTSWKTRAVPLLVPIKLSVEAADSKNIYNWKKVTECTTEGKDIAKFVDRKFFVKNQHGWPKQSHFISCTQEGNYVFKLDEKQKHFCVGKGGPHTDQQVYFTLRLFKRNWELRQLCWSKQGKCATLFKEAPLAKWRESEIKLSAVPDEKHAQPSPVIIVTHPSSNLQVPMSNLPGPLSPKWDDSEEETDELALPVKGKDEKKRKGTKDTKNKKRSTRRSRQTAAAIFKDFLVLQPRIRVAEYDQGTREDIYGAFKTFGETEGIPPFEQVLEVEEEKKEAVMTEYKLALPWSANMYKGRGERNKFRALMQDIHPAWNPKTKIDDVAFVRLIMATVPKEELNRLKIINQQGHMYFFNKEDALWEYRSESKRVGGAFWKVVRRWVQRREVYFADKRGRDSWISYTNSRSTLGTRTWDAFLDQMELKDATLFFKSLDSAEWQVPLMGKKVFDCATATLRERTSNDFFRSEMKFQFSVPEEHKALWADIVYSKEAPQTEEEILEKMESLKKMFPDAMYLLLSPFQNPLQTYDFLRAKGSCFSRKNLKTAYFIYGPTGATKSTIKNADSHLFGDFFGTSKPAAWQVEKFEQANSHTAQLCHWEGKMMVVTDEIPAHMPLAVDKFKSYLSQKGSVRVRAPHAKEEHEMAINFPFFFIFNKGDVPRFDANAAELTRRMAVFEANRSHFTTEDTVVRIPKNFPGPNRHTYNDLPVAERTIDGIEYVWASPEKQKKQAMWADEKSPPQDKLNQLGTLYLLMAHIVWKETHGGTCNIPWTKATLDARDRMVYCNDTVGKFLSEFYQEDIKEMTPLKDMWLKFQTWREGIRGFVMVFDTFRQALVEKRLLLHNMVLMKEKKDMKMWESSEPSSNVSLKRKDAPEPERKKIKLSDLGNCSLIPEIAPDGTAGCPKCWEPLKKHLMGYYCDSEDCMFKWPNSILNKKQKRKETKSRAIIPVSTWKNLPTTDKDGSKLCGCGGKMYLTGHTYICQNCKITCPDLGGLT